MFYMIGFYILLYFFIGFIWYEYYSVKFGYGSIFEARKNEIFAIIINLLLWPIMLIKSLK